ncbi:MULTISPECIES: hypothetical protein [Mesorhizobium]|uniref:hypothetical protein n=1 Tax=Mesorhizobium TaxID=68287 RepID=UPI00131502D5|nr:MULTISPECIES: hypothetical protein [Mesorhizobium]
MSRAKIIGLTVFALLIAGLAAPSLSIIGDNAVSIIGDQDANAFSAIHADD